MCMKTIYQNSNILQVLSQKTLTIAFLYSHTFELCVFVILILQTLALSFVNENAFNEDKNNS